MLVNGQNTTLSRHEQTISYAQHQQYATRLRNTSEPISSSAHVGWALSAMVLGTICREATLSDEQSAEREEAGQHGVDYRWPEHRREQSRDAPGYLLGSYSRAGISTPTTDRVCASSWSVQWPAPQSGSL
jgi:hypothetical protein